MSSSAPTTPKPNGSPLGDAVAHSFRKTITSLQNWECGTRGQEESDFLRIAFTEDEPRFDPIITALYCSPDGLKDEFQCNGDDLSETTEEDQMRRLSSWGTYGTLESVELNRDARFDDDGRPIDPKLMEKARENRQRITRPRLVKFAYPPVTSLRQCPRLEPEDINQLFFTTQELDQYEEDRRQTNVVDDVEIVAVSTSSGSSDDDSDDIPPANKFGRYIPSPTKQKKKSIETARKQKKRPTSPRSPTEKGKESRRLLKSVQIFLRERSTAA